MSFQDKKRKHLGKNEAPSIGDTAEKLRLIRERQNKWMKERDEARSSETPSSKRSSSNTPGSSVLVKSLSQEALQMELSYSSRSSTGNRDKRNNPRRKPLYPQPKSDRSKVITWTTKGDRKTAKRPPSGHSRSSSVASADVNYLMATKSSSKPSRTYKPTNYSATAKTTQKTYDNSHPDSSRRAHVNNTFDQGFTRPPRKGNPYVEREVQNIYKEHSTKSENEIEEIPSNFKTPGFGSSELPAHLLDALAVTVAAKLRTELSPEKNNKIKASGKTGRDSDMSSHYCNVCKELMTSPRHTPTAAIPCGHTCCKVCIRECQKCPTCGTRILSTAVNTVLESIITDFKAEKERERLQKLEQETRKYVDEYQSLSLRCEALTDEAECILGNMESVTNELVEEKKAIKRFETESQQIQHKIQQLEEQLEQNNNLQQKCQEKCTELERKYNEEKDRLSMAEDTVRTIQKTKDKIKLLVHNLAPSLNLDNFDS